MKNRPRIKELFVDSIDFDATEEDLRKLFSVCGTVRSIHLLKDQHNQFKGAAFIRLASDAEHRDAIQMLDDARLLKRCIRVVAARPKAQLGESDTASPPNQERPRDPRKGQSPRRKRAPKGSARQ